MEPFVEAACRVLEQVLGGRAVPGPLGLLGTTFSVAGTNIVLQVNGSLSGDVVYSLSSRTAAELARNLNGTADRAFGPLAAAGIGKLGEMLARAADRALSEGGWNCSIGAPIVFRGPGVEFWAGDPALSVAIDTGAGQFHVNVAVRSDE